MEVNLQGKSISPMSSFPQKTLIIEFQPLPFPFPSPSKSPAPLSAHEGCKPTQHRPPSGYANCDICHSLHQGTFNLPRCYCVANSQPHPESSHLYREIVPCRIFHRREQDHCCAPKASLYRCINRSEWGERCRQVGNLSFITSSQWGRDTEGENDREERGGG